MAALEWNLYFKNDTICVTIKAEEGFEPRITQVGDMDANMHAAVHCMAEVARCLARGISISHYFNPSLGQQEKEVLVKCQWMRSGKLFCTGETSKRYHHCNTVDEAMMQKRTFTCTRSLYNLVPKRRPATKQPRRQSVTPKKESEEGNGSPSSQES